MTPLYFLIFAVLLLILTLAAYVDRVYSEMGKFLAREYQDNIDSWEQIVEPKLGLGRESLALSASVLRQLSVAAIALLTGLRLYTHTSLLPSVARSPSGSEIVLAIFEIILLILIFDRLLPQVLFTRTSGLWIVRIRFVLQTVFYIILPVTLLLGLLSRSRRWRSPKTRRRKSGRRRRWRRCSKPGRRRASSKSRTASWCARWSSLATRSRTR